MTSRFIYKILGLDRKKFVFGDSHARVFEYLNNNLKKQDKFQVLAIGGATAQGLANPRSKTNALQLFQDRIKSECGKRDFLFFFLGEVDCGFVIWYRAKKYNEPVKFQFERSLKNYEDFLCELKAKGFKNICIIETVLPTIFDGFQGEIANERREVEESIENRTKLTIQYNKRLKEMAENRNFKFISITDKLIDPKTGLIKKEFLNQDSTDHHLCNARFGPLILEKVEKVYS